MESACNAVGWNWVSELTSSPSGEICWLRVLHKWLKSYDACEVTVISYIFGRIYRLKNAFGFLYLLVPYLEIQPTYMENILNKMCLYWPYIFSMSFLEQYCIAFACIMCDLLMI